MSRIPDFPTTQRPTEIPQPFSVMGTNVTPFESFEDAVCCISARIANKQKTFCVAINPVKIYHARHSPNVAAALAKADIGACDGIGVVLAARILYGKTVRRCTDLLLERLISIAATNGWRVFLLGASSESNRKAADNFLKRFPTLQLAGCRDGYFEDSHEVVRQINQSRPDLLFVAMGSPKQELWIAEHKDEINAYFSMGVGGAFDVVSRKAKRAPKFFRRTGTEFLFRFVNAPRKRWRRQIIRWTFAFSVLREKFFEKYRS